MRNSLKSPLIVAVMVALVLLGAASVQLAAGDYSDEDKLPPPVRTFSPDTLATNEAHTWTEMTTEADEHLRVTPATEGPYVEPFWPSPTADPRSDGVITEYWEPRMGDHGYVWQNGWMSVVDSYHIEVAAGALRDGSAKTDAEQPQTGVLRVTTDIRELNDEYRMAEPEGPLRIVGASNQTCLDLVVVTTRRSLQFDVRTREWWCSPK